MNNYYTKNFDVTDFIHKNCEKVFEKDWLYDENSFWHLHIKDADGKFPSHLANSMWFDFTDAIDCFYLNYEGLFFDNSINEKKALTKFRIDLKIGLQICFQKVKEVISKKYGLNFALYKFSPSALDCCLFEDEGYDHKQYISIMSAYAILQIDEGITGLIEKDAVKSASSFLYSARAIECINSVMADILSVDSINKAFSDRAHKGASARNATYEPLRRMAKELVNLRNFRSRRNAAMSIKSAIIAESKKLNIPLSESQAEITITGWLSDMGLPANVKH